VTAPIIGASKIAHLEEAVGALEIALEAEEITALEQLYEPHPVLGHR
ncbi:MAG: aldo/keto reductase, partial [Alphaproteobacteria bacterium]